jgi:hypothetical protein
LAPFREHLAPFREHLAPFREHLAPFREHLAPFREQLAPFREHLARTCATTVTFRAMRDVRFFFRFSFFSSPSLASSPFTPILNKIRTKKKKPQIFINIYLFILATSIVVYVQKKLS